MPRFAANLSMLYGEHAFLDRFAAARRDGFDAVEFLFPYAHAPAEVAARLKDQGLQQVLFNAPVAGTDAAAMVHAWDSGQGRGTAAMPGQQAEFRVGMRLALEYAQALACPRLHVMAGRPAPELDAGLVHDTYVANLAWAAGQAAACGVQVLIEPINRRDMPGYYLNRQDHAHRVVAEVGAANLSVQMDLYHCQVVEGDVATKIRQYLPTGQVGHIQVAGVPDRHEPDEGELNGAYLLQVLDEVAAASGWSGWVGCEYRPRRGAVPGGTSDGLGWLRRLQTR